MARRRLPGRAGRKGALAAGAGKTRPVEDAVADGFYTIATQPNQSALGRGVWDAGRWSAAGVLDHLGRSDGMISSGASA